jgi:predicted short-subunit dehydrogenase-like oxidoreductase (DUF2520 family)
MISVSIIGPGRVGGALAIALPKEKYLIDQIIGRGPIDQDHTAFTHARSVAGLQEISLVDSDVIFITTGDENIRTVSRYLVSRVKKGSFVFHTSGALTSTVMDSLAAAGCYIGSIHPLVSISKPELGPTRFPNAFFCIEGDPPAIEMAYSIVADLGGHPFTIATKFKTLYHAAAVMACGHLVALFDSSVEVLTHCGLTPERSKEILLPLVASTVENLGQQSTSSALTGTFGRADIETFSRHLTTLNENVSDNLLEIYLLLGERSLELASREGVNAERIDSLRAKMSVAKSRLKW